MSMFQGNKSESTTLEPIMGEVKKSYGLGRIVVVADKGLNSSSNIERIVNNDRRVCVLSITQRYKGETV